MSDESPFDAFTTEPEPEGDFDAFATDNTDTSADAFQQAAAADDSAGAFGLEMGTEQDASDAFGFPQQDASDAFGLLDGGDDDANPSFGLEPEEIKEVVDDEPTALSIWQAERAKVLEERATASAQKKAELLEKAREQIESAANTRADSLANKQTVNREAEETFKKNMASLMEFGSRWEKVNKLVNLAPKPGDIGQSKDRMRKLLIQLKNIKDDVEEKTVE